MKTNTTFAAEGALVELSSADPRLKAARARARETMNTESIAMMARWSAMTAVGLGGIALIPSVALQVPLMIATSGFLQRWITSGMLHEATHGTLWREKKVNERLGHWLAGIALVDFDAFRSKHLAHHKDLATERDPEVVDMSEYGFKRTGMTAREIALMLAQPLMPRHLARNAANSYRALLTNPWPLTTLVMALTPLALLGAPIALIALAWLAGSFMVRPFLWLLANSTEHDFVLGDEIERRSTPRGARLAEMGKEIQWLAVSRERRGLFSLIACPESERLNHNDHHAQAALPGGSLAGFAAKRASFDALYATERRITHGLFFGRDGFESAYASLMNAARRDCANADTSAADLGVPPPNTDLPWFGGWERG